MNAEITDGFLTVKQFAEELQVTEARVQAWVRDGHLPVVRLGRLAFVPKDALHRALDRQEVQRV